MPTRDFAYTGGWQHWTVPKEGIAGNAVEVTLVGADSGSTRGGLVDGRMKVKPGQELWVQVGGQGKAPAGNTGGAAPFGGGGAGGTGNGRSGGWSGGGASMIRVGSKTGTIRCVAGGAGGASGDSSPTGCKDNSNNPHACGVGGEGGADIGESGWRGTAGTNVTGQATGGTQNQGGTGGDSTAGRSFWGFDAPEDGSPGRGGAGGSALSTTDLTFGGGGGGGGYRSGGGGMAGLVGYSPGGGGGGGSNYIGTLTGWRNLRGDPAHAGHGLVRIKWTAKSPANQPPRSPSGIKVNGKAETPEMATKSTSKVRIEVTNLGDPDNDRVRVQYQYATDAQFSDASRMYQTELADVRRKNGKPVTPWQLQPVDFVLNGLHQTTHYWVRMRTIDSHGLPSEKWTHIDFWTNRAPTAPDLLIPSENMHISNLAAITFDWTHNDPDPNDSQKGFRLKYARLRTPFDTDDPTVHVVTQATVDESTWLFDPSIEPNEPLPGNSFYEWTVQTRDQQGLWGEWAEPKSFYVYATASPPRDLIPASHRSADVSDPVAFSWKFQDPDTESVQTMADIRYRAVDKNDQPYGDLPGAPPGSIDWITVTNVPTEQVGPTRWRWMSKGVSFADDQRYEWQAQTYNRASSASGWSESAYFHATRPGQQSGPPALVGTATQQGSLGCGSYQVFIYRQPRKFDGKFQHVLVGEVTPMSQLAFNRVRDDISNCIVHTNGFGPDCCAMLGSMRSWLHELVVFRDGQRVWEGPITRITYDVDSVEIEAKDVMAYVYRRILRQGFNDSFRKLDNQEIGNVSVVTRARQIIMDALSRHDPDVLAYLTAFSYPNDAQQNRVVSDYAKSAWEEVDDLAATAGLDYVTIGRRIMLWDTHRPIGRLPEMRDGDFATPPIITEYGMQLINYAAVTNGTGVWGAVNAKDPNTDEQVDPLSDYYGPIEVVASAYGEEEAQDTGELSSKERQKLQETFRDQARRNAAGHWPTPVVVRVPDNSALNPDVALGFDQLVPGVWIPLRSAKTCRTVTQWQKLDSVSVLASGGEEQVSVVMSPAPQGGQDPDAGNTGEVPE